jgi:hypothetical protein
VQCGSWMCSRHFDGYFTCCKSVFGYSSVMGSEDFDELWTYPMVILIAAGASLDQSGLGQQRLVQRGRR